MFNIYIEPLRTILGVKGNSGPTDSPSLNIAYSLMYKNH